MAPASERSKIHRGSNAQFMTVAAKIEYSRNISAYDLEVRTLQENLQKPIIIQDRVVQLSRSGQLSDTASAIGRFQDNYWLRAQSSWGKVKQLNIRGIYSIRLQNQAINWSWR